MRGWILIQHLVLAVRGLYPPQISTSIGQNFLHHGCVTQRLECLPVEQKVVGSNPITVAFVHSSKNRNASTQGVTVLNACHEQQVRCQENDVGIAEVTIA